VKSLADRERAESLAAIKARMYSRVGGEAETSSSNTNSTSKDKCNQMTLSSVIAGGNCK
jgi:ectoine hydroxylase-related dioxygenase (phytanoyl-CoA dioxygenase family)